LNPTVDPHRRPIKQQGGVLEFATGKKMIAVIGLLGLFTVSVELSVK